MNPWEGICLGRSRSRPECPEGIRIQRRKSVRASRGFSMIEILVVIILIGFFVALAGPVAGKLIRRSEDMAALSTIRQVLAVARLDAIKTSANTVVIVGKNPSNMIHLKSFRDKADLTTPSGNDGNGVQDAGETTLGEVTLSPRIHLRKGSSEDVGDAVLFDTCAGDASSRCIVFLSGGGISVPSPDPNPATPTDGRGIYFSDWQGKNYFRVTVESNLSGKARVDKYVEG